MPNQKNDLVSVIVLAYNSSPFIIQTLESIRKQTYRNIELIISDDNSSDNTEKLCLDWLALNNKCFTTADFFKAKRNRGIPGNCNFALSKSSGDFIKIIAADDYLSCTYLEKCLPLFSNNKVGLVFTFSYIYLENKKQTIKEYNNSKYRRGDIFNDILLLNFWPKAPSFIYRKEVFQKCGTFDETIWAEDYLMFLKIAHQYLIDFVPEYLTYYRLHSNNNGGESIKLYEAQLDSIKHFKKEQYYHKARKNILNRLSLFAMRHKPSYLIYMFIRNYFNPIYLKRYVIGIVKSYYSK